MPLLFNSVTKSPYISRGIIPAPQNTADVPAMYIALLITFVFAVVVIVGIWVIISMKKERNLAEERAKQNKEFIEKLLGKKKTK